MAPVFHGCVTCGRFGSCGMNGVFYYPPHAPDAFFPNRRRAEGECLQKPPVDDIGDVL